MTIYQISRIDADAGKKPVEVSTPDMGQLHGLCVLLPAPDEESCCLLLRKLLKDDSAVYGLCGFMVEMDEDSSLSGRSLFVSYDRRKGKQRYAMLDDGDVTVHAFTETAYAFNADRIDPKLSSNPIAWSNYLEHSGIRRVVVDTQYWKGPRSTATRHTRCNFGASYYKPLEGVFKKIELPKVQASEEQNYLGHKPDGLDTTDYLALEHSGQCPITIVITTHNRTDTAIKTIESLVKHIVYPKLKWCLCDDRSTGDHVARVMDKFGELGVEDVKICRTTNVEWGLGASMNNGLRYAFSNSPIVLTVEDDWLLKKDLDLGPYVSYMLGHEDCGTIRFGFLYVHDGVVLGNDNGLLTEITMRNGDVSAWTITNQIALRHRRFYDQFGMYMENCHPDISERNMCLRYNEAKDKPKVYWPTSFKTNTMYDESLPFEHFGESLVGHNWDKGTKPFFRIITPTYNTSDLLIRCARSLDVQDFRDFVWLVVDDASTNDTPEIIQDLAKTRSWMKYLLLKKNVCAGGARNAACHISDSEYTLYLDSDDYALDYSSVGAVHDAIVNADFPDIIRLNMVNDGKATHTTVDRLEDYVNISPGPPLNCHKTSISVHAVPNRRNSNDVVWFYRLCDKAETVSSMSEPWFVYDHTCVQSSWFGDQGKADPRTRACKFYVVADLMVEKFKKECVRKSAERRRRNYEKQLLPGYDH